MSYHYSVTPHFRELFDCPSYSILLGIIVDSIFCFAEVNLYTENLGLLGRHL